VTLSATCQESMTVYFNGVPQPPGQPQTPAMKDWKQTSYLTIPENTSVLAIECTAKRTSSEKGILASASTTPVVNSGNTWKCSSVAIPSWTILKDSTLPPVFADAQEIGRNGALPWGLREAISSDANWIWPVVSNKTTSTWAGCRITL